MDNIDKDKTGLGTAWIILIRTKLVQELHKLWSKVVKDQCVK